MVSFGPIAILSRIFTKSDLNSLNPSEIVILIWMTQEHNGIEPLQLYIDSQ